MLKIQLLIFISCLSSIAIAKPLDSLRVEIIKGQKFILHKVEKREVLGDLTKRYKVSSADLLKHNEIKNNRIEKGQVIRIPYTSVDSKVSSVIPPDSAKGVDEAHANAQSVEVQKVLTHVVQQGENLNSIAKKYKLTAAQLTKWNNLRNAKVVVGQTLIVDELALAKPYQKINGTDAQMPQQAQQVRLAGSDLIEQTGIAFVDESMLVLHPEAPVGTIIKVINLENGKQCLVKVSGELDRNKYKNFVISIGKEAQEKLGSASATLRVKLVYVLKP